MPPKRSLRKGSTRARSGKRAKPRSQVSRRGSTESKRSTSGLGRGSASFQGRLRNGFSSTISAKGGQEDREDTELVWEYIISSGLNAATDLLFCIKGNSIYRPGGIATVGLGLTTSPVGYARLYTQYRLACVMSSRIEVSAWGASGTIAGGVPTGGVVNVPLRLGVVPAQSTAAIAYSSGNVSSIGSYPHGTMSFSNNTVRARNHGDIGMLNTGEGKFNVYDQADGSYSASVSSDPGVFWYYTVGVGNASTALNATNFQCRIRVFYKVRFYQPIFSDIQVARDHFGNEVTAGSATETKSALAAMRAGLTSGENATVERVESKGDTKRSHVRGFACAAGCAEHPPARPHTTRAAYEDDLVDFPGMDSDEEESYYAWRDSIRRNAHADNGGPSWAQLKAEASSTKTAGAGATKQAPPAASVGKILADPG